MHSGRSLYFLLVKLLYKHGVIYLYNNSTMIIQLLYKILQTKKSQKKIPRTKACLMQTFILDINVH